MSHKPLSLLLMLTLCLTFAVTASADMRTKTIRLVPEQDWTASAQPIAINGAVNASEEHSAELRASMDDWFAKAFEKLGYQVTENAPLRFDYTIDYVDWGNRLRRLVVGFNNSGLGGTLVLTEDGKEVGRFRYSSKLRGGIAGGSTRMMGKEIAPPLVLKLHNGERDTELHERP